MQSDPDALMAAMIAGSRPMPVERGLPHGSDAASRRMRHG